MIRKIKTKAMAKEWRNTRTKIMAGEKDDRTS